ncbi:Cof-type HAD-IIB family hydrolase [Paenibacillus eucommiae]|uniref:Cof subfamily protein (Haloacid dehalogenase superfamily) n=1 Tax=Paenibacillus eucommiae TaxID=1355755 RepID=A0ABS4IRT2_9BACL|nr:Cof-type HAD-IIB family hydrolase [Paenibacillus eucommiae]MBP1990263.1 Cof subfamily protein (haloacid dehalogenase superfamily) [Paenibacillus eucommiae]
MYKLLAIDLDDTLLTDDLHITEGTKEAIEKAILQGVTVTFATGRSFPSASKIAEQIGLNVPIITYQGSLIKNLLDGEVLYERSVPAAAADLIYDYCEARNLHLQLYFDDKLYVKEYNEKVKDYVRLTNLPYFIADNFRELAKQPQTKMLIIDDPALLDQMAVELQVILQDQVHITKSKAHYLEFLHKEGNKGSAVTFLANHIGCEIDQVIAIGDSWNDREMLEAAGLGVAMGNALDELKAIAGYVTSSNNEEGVKHVIDKFILQK